MEPKNNELVRSEFEVLTKKCSRCKVEKDVRGFWKCKTSNDGLQYICKDCKKRHYQANKVEIAEYKKQYYQTNKKGIAERSKQYYESNTQKIADQKADYHIKNRDAIAYKKRSYRLDKKFPDLVPTQYNYNTNGPIFEITAITKEELFANPTN